MEPERPEIVSSTSSSLGGMATPDSLPRRSPEPADKFKQAWDDALGICRQTLGEQYFNTIAEFETYEKLLDHLKSRYENYSNRTVPGLLRSLEGYLIPLRRLSHACALAMRKHYIKTGLIWGLVNLMIEFSVMNEKVLTLVVDMIEELSHQLEMLLLYQATPVLTKDMDHAFVAVFVDVITFASYTVDYLRRKPFRNLASIAWPEDISKKLEKTSKRIKKQYERIKEKVIIINIQSGHADLRARADIFRGMDQLSLVLPDSDSIVNDQGNMEAKLPCHCIPLAANASFYGRDDLFEILHENLDHPDDDRPRQPVALWGTAGIGKTQVALAFAWNARQRNLPLVLWINSENSLDMNRSFTKIATLLQLKDATPHGTDEHNRFLVHQFLEKTDANWLVVFDNVEDMDLIRECWPSSPYGSILLTSRRKIVSQGILNLEVPAFSDGDGAQFLLKQINQKKSPKEELDAAEELSMLLGGFPLGLTLMAMRIRVQETNVQKYLPFYKQHWMKLHGISGEILKPYYTRGLSTAWDISFSALEKQSSDATTLFGVLCLMASDDIPTDLFRPAQQDLLPTQLSFCSNLWSFEEACRVLLQNSMVKNNADTNALSVHRLIQIEYLRRADTQRRGRYLELAIRLLHTAFPSLGDDLTLRDHWPTCKEYVQHVSALATNFVKLDFGSPQKVVILEFAECLSSCAWFLFESGAFSDCMRILDAGFRLCSDKDSLLHANLLNIAGSIAGTRNRSKEAYKLFEESRRIRSLLLPDNHEHLANIYNNLANELLATGEYPDAMRLYHKAIDIDANGKRKEILYVRYVNLGNVYMFQGNFEKAREQIDIGRKHAEKETGGSSEYDEVAAWDIANIHYREGSLPLARIWFERAWQVSFRENPFHPMTGAALYRMGCVDLKEGRVDDAIKNLKQAHLLAEYNQATQGDQGDRGRVLRRLAEAYYKKGDDEKGKKFHLEAEGIRKELQGTRYTALPDTEEVYDQLVSYYFYYYR